jgi:hypothetical protein
MKDIEMKLGLAKSLAEAFDLTRSRDGFLDFLEQRHIKSKFSVGELTVIWMALNQVYGKELLREK